MARTLVRQFLPDNIVTFVGPAFGSYTPNPLALFIEFELVGGGGGGGAGATASTSYPGTIGGDSVFGGTTASGGNGGGSGGSGGGGGGGVTVGAEVSQILLQLFGGQGGSGLFSGAAVISNFPVGAPGGTSPYSCGSTNAFSNTTPSPGPGWGSGGAGGGCDSSESVYSGSGGGAGGFIRAIIPNANFAAFGYTVGSEGSNNGGTGYVGAIGQVGYLLIRERFQ
jgi:hypothetical protein